MRFIAIAGALLLAIGALGPAGAHRQPEVFTTVTHSLVKGAPVTQVTHRFHAHDAIAVLGRMEGVTSPSLEEDANLLRLARYVHARFAVAGAPLKPLGGELEGNFVYFYEERAGHADIVGSTILRDIDRGWSNHVTIEKADGTKVSLLFSEESGTRLPSE